jgi:hypothetical protein
VTAPIASEIPWSSAFCHGTRTAMTTTASRYSALGAVGALWSQGAPSLSERPLSTEEHCGGRSRLRYPGISTKLVGLRRAKKDGRGV